MDTGLETVLQQRLMHLEQEIQKIRFELDGDAFKDFDGIRSRVRKLRLDCDELKSLVDALKEEREGDMRWRKGLLVCIGLLALLGILNLVAQVVFLR